MEIGMVKKIDINNEMEQAYLDYAMSVIVSRALPDARDGLKPVHRRILYSMYDLGLQPGSTYKKSARIVGEVLGKYHPHGDMAVYDAMTRMAQDFSMRYQLVDGQGNFGSVDGDSPAAMRYTEARLRPIAGQMLENIDKNTVDFEENFDGTLLEPSVLPASTPNLLVNGATGIAVGMATSIPPHNLREVIDAIQYMINNWAKIDNIGIDDLMQFIKGPDFPTGGVIIQDVKSDGLKSAYSTGRGKLTVQARVHLEEMVRGRNRIIVTELPYMTNKSSLIERIADLARENKIEGIVDLRDESDRQGMRIVIELTKNADPENVLARLYKYTPMQNTLSIIMLALVKGEPRLLSIKQALKTYIEHRLEIVRRRSEFDLEKAAKRLHILEGLKIAIQNLDEIISLIRKAPDSETAQKRLMRKYTLSVIQSQAILDMPLRRLSALERKKLEEEFRNVTALIKRLKALLKSERKMRTVVSDELHDIREKYGDRRRTQLAEISTKSKKKLSLTTTDLTPEKPIWILLTKKGLISRTIQNKLPRLSGTEAPHWIIKTSTRDTLYLVLEDGKTASIPTHQVPEAEKASKGVPFQEISPLLHGDKIAGIFTIPPRTNQKKSLPGFDEWFILTATRKGYVKKTLVSSLPGTSAEPFILVKVNDDDTLLGVRLTNGDNDILLTSSLGMSIRFNESDIRPMGLVAAGVMGIKLRGEDEVVALDILPQQGEVFLVTSDGRAKRIEPAQFPEQGRYGQGVVAWKLVEGSKVVGMVVGKGPQKAALVLSKLLPKAIRLDEAPIQGRTARGKEIIQLKPGDQVRSLSVPWDVPRLGTIKKT